MQVVFHVPSKVDADTTPQMLRDLTIKPKFYRRIGTVPLFYITTIDAAGNEEQHVITLNAGNKQLRIERLVEVIPKCDDVENEEELTDEISEEIEGTE